MSPYNQDLAAIHAAGFTDLARAAARELLGRLAGRAQVVELGCGDGTTARLLASAGHDVSGVDLSQALIARARAQVPEASFAVGSFVDYEFSNDCDAILAVGEVLGYELDPSAEKTTLDSVFARSARALRPEGVLMFDLARPDRLRSATRRDWVEGVGWVVLVDSRSDGRILTRQITTFRDRGEGCFHRAQETHRLRLHRPADVLARLRRAGLRARTLPAGYAGTELAQGVTAYLARKPKAS